MHPHPSGYLNAAPGVPGFYCSLLPTLLCRGPPSGQVTGRGLFTFTVSSEGGGGPVKWGSEREVDLCSLVPFPLGGHG